MFLPPTPAEDWIVPSGSTDWSVENVLQGDFFADDLIFMMNSLKASNGTLDTSFCSFDHYSIDDIWLSLDGDRYAGAELRRGV